MIAFLRFLDRLTRATSRAGSILSMAVLVAMVVLVLVEIVLRSVFARSTFFSVEVVGYGMAAMTFLALGDMLREGGLIKVEALLNVLPDGSRRLIGAVIACLTLAVLAIPLWYVGRSALTNYVLGYRSMTMAQVPLWIPEGAMWLGIALFWLQLLAHALSLAVEGTSLEKPETSLTGAID